MPPHDAAPVIGPTIGRLSASPGRFTMRPTLLAAGLFVGFVVVASRPVQSQSVSEKQSKAAAEQKKAAPAAGKSEAPVKAAVDHSADEAAIRTTVEAFAKAYNGH